MLNKLSALALLFGLLVFYFGCGGDNTLSSLSISPTTATVGINKSQAFSAVGKNSSGNIISISPSWGVSTSTMGAISSTGIFTAGASAGSGSVIVTAEGLTAQSTVTVTESGWIAGRVFNSQGSLVQSLKVYLKNTSLFDYTDSGGDYSISSVPAGTYEVLTEQTTIYRAASSEATVTKGGTSTVNFTVLFFTDPPDLTPPSFP